MIAEIIVIGGVVYYVNRRTGMISSFFKSVRNAKSPLRRKSKDLFDELERIVSSRDM